ncbi:MAG: methyl-accepting chemotaxis protein [Pseudomonadota bacterium]
MNTQALTLNRPSLQAARRAPPIPRPLAQPAAPDAGLQFFSHHGVWAPGVRLFRRIGFAAKAALVSAAFLVPIALLMTAYLQTVQSSLAITEQERTGVDMLRAIEPWIIEVQKQRRLVLSGMATGVDMAAIDDKLRPVAALVKSQPAGVDATGALAEVMVSHAALASAAAQGNDLAHVEDPVQAYVEAIRRLRTTVLDMSQLLLDPEQATFYLMSVSSVVVSDVIESVSRSRGLAGSIAKAGATPQQMYTLYALWHAGREQLDTIRDQLVRAAAAEPSIASRAPYQDAIEATDAFYEASAASWFSGAFAGDVEALNTPGQRSVDALRKLSAEGTNVLDELLTARIAGATRQRNMTIGVTALSLLAVLYLFSSFYRVMRGGLSEVERHLRAMTDGDLTTSPRPWGTDEAARLMFTLSAMQAALRTIVSEVRTASHGLVQASDEIASASDNLSQRSEQAAANLEESASAMEQISTTGQHTAESTRTASQLASDNADIATAGGQTIDQVVQTMKGVQASSARIADIIGVIDGIAFQTNILALNAAVEAARAGEQGRGFAVVASEVRALAQRSAAAAREIKTLIHDSGEQVNAGTQVVALAGRQMDELVGTAERMKSLMAEVLTGSSEQAAGVRLVGDALQTLDQQTQQNAALVEQTAAAAGALHDQANALAARVARFRLPV